MNPTVLLIGVDARSPLTILDGNHRMAAAMLAQPPAELEGFQFICGLSPAMTRCCWYRTNVNTLSRYLTNLLRHVFYDPESDIGRFQESDHVVRRTHNTARRLLRRLILIWRRLRLYRLVHNAIVAATEHRPVRAAGATAPAPGATFASTFVVAIRGNLQKLHSLRSAPRRNCPRSPAIRQLVAPDRRRIGRFRGLPRVRPRSQYC